ncbi:hypothetical protein QQP08_025675 [Theobroma cacao]|nr:hypothetical protein QQP08_025675 [Theobroma cacao]
MYTQAIEVSTVVSSTETRFTALLSRMLRPEIFFTVGPGFPTTCGEITNQKKEPTELKGCSQQRIYDTS